MKAYAIRCTQAPDNDPTLSWAVGDWRGCHLGNPVQEFRYAEMITDPDQLARDMDMLKGFKPFGVEFEVVEFVPSDYESI